MNQYQIDKIKALDEDSTDGSIQSLLLRSDLNQVQFSDACFYLAQVLKSDKESLLLENAKLVKILKKYGLYTSEELFGDA